MHQRARAAPSARDSRDRRHRAVIFGERRERGLERAAEPAKRGGLLLRDFVVQRGDVLGPANGGCPHIHSGIIVGRNTDRSIVGGTAKDISPSPLPFPGHHRNAGVRVEVAPRARPKAPLARTSSGVAFGPTSVKTRKYRREFWPWRRGTGETHRRAAGTG